jgi:hypothetical protein
MAEELDNSEMRREPRAISDERLDRLLIEARWSQMSPAVLERMVKTALPPTEVARRARAAWWVGTLATAAVLAIAAMLWALWPSQPPQPLVERQPGVEQVEPAREPEAPRFHYAVLPGREATTAERAWAQVIRREQAKQRVTEPPPEQSRPPVEKGL